MSVSWVAGSTAVFAGDGETAIDTVSGTTPAGIADDDTLLAAVFARTALTTPSGWTKLIETAEFDNTGLFQRMAVFSKDTVTSGNSSTSFDFLCTFEADVSTRMGLVYAVARDVDAITTDSNVVNNTDTFQITPDTLTATANGSMLVAFASTIFGPGAATTPTTPTSFTLSSGSSLTDYRLAAAYRAVNASEGNSGAFHMYPSNTPGEANGLGAITLLLEPAGITAIDGLIAVAGPLGAVRSVGIHSRAGLVAVASPLGAVLALALHDFTADFEGQSLLYVMDLTTPSGTVRVPISSWQATLQTEQQNYTQCVVPACLPYVAQINAATAFSISRRATLADGTAFEYEMAAAPLDNASMAQGTANYSATLSGYSPGSAVDADPPEDTSRVLTGVRTIFTQPSGLRVRCAIDWLLRPAQLAYVEGTPFIVSYINYYVSDGDQYMDVGERVEA